MHIIFFVLYRKYPIGYLFFLPSVHYSTHEKTRKGAGLTKQVGYHASAGGLVCIGAKNAILKSVRFLAAFLHLFN